jgi:hypothetical protein
VQVCSQLCQQQAAAGRAGWAHMTSAVYSRFSGVFSGGSVRMKWCCRRGCVRRAGWLGGVGMWLAKLLAREGRQASAHSNRHTK